MIETIAKMFSAVPKVKLYLKNNYNWFCTRQIVCYCILSQKLPSHLSGTVQCESYSMLQDSCSAGN